MATNFNALYAQLQKQPLTAVTSSRFSNDVISIQNPNRDPNNPKAVYDDLLTDFSMRVTENLDPSSSNSALAHSVEILTLAKNPNTGAEQGVYLEGDWEGYTFQEATMIWPGDDVNTNTGHFEASHGAYLGPKRSINDNFTMSYLNDIVYSKTGDDTVAAGAGDDIVYAGSGNDMIFGESGRDFLFGESGDDTIYGGDGDDHIEGGTGADILSGDAGDDEIFGGDGDDGLFGGTGNDTLFGGSGSDIFFWKVGDGVDYFVEYSSDSGVDAVVIQDTTDLFVIKAGNHLALGTDNNNWAMLYNWYLDPGIEAVVIGGKVYAATTIASMATNTATQNYAATLTAAEQEITLNTEGLTSIDFSKLTEISITGLSDIPDISDSVMFA